MNVDDVGKLTIALWDGLDQVAEMVQHYRMSAKAGTGPTQAQLLAAMVTNLRTPIANCFSGTAMFYGWKWEQITGTIPDAQVSYDNTVGNRAVGLAPGQVAALIRFFTGFLGRHGRARKYVPFISAGDFNADGSVVASLATALNALGASFLTTVNAGTGGNTGSFIPVVHDRVNLISTALNGMAVASEFATQRRRAEINRPDAFPF